MKSNILYISFDFNYTCGVSKHVYVNLKYLSKSLECSLYFLTNGGDSLDRLNLFKNINLTIKKFTKDHKNIFYLIRDAIQLYLFCKRNKIDIIHTHHRYAELLSVIVSKFYKLKTITTVHSLVDGLNKISFRSDKIICVSNSIMDNLHQKYSHTKKRTELLYNCLDFDSLIFLTEANQTKKSKIKSNIWTILFVGRDNRTKGFDILLSALETMEGKHKVKLIVAGFNTSNELTNLKIINCEIEFAGIQRDLTKYYLLCDVVVIPSRRDSFPYVMLEAAAMIKPVIASNIDGLGEFISDGDDGTLFKAENDNQLAEKICYVFENYDKAIEMAEKLYLKVKLECDCKLYFQKLKKAYGLL